MKKKKLGECYMCTADAFSIEHIPPSCLFPESKDVLSGVNYRKNLITVPSCMEHNLRKSQDDEYLLYILVTNWAVNDIGLNQWKTKVLRSIHKRPTKLGIYKNLRPATVNGIITGCFDLNFERISKELEKISRGIYYFHFKKKWLHPTTVWIPDAISAKMPDANLHNIGVQVLSESISKFLVTEPVFGENREIFHYQFKVDKDEPYYVLQMVFYGGIKISTISNLEDRSTMFTA